MHKSSSEMKGRSGNDPEFYQRFFKKSAIALVVIGGSPVAYNIVFSIILCGHQCDNYNGYKALEVHGTIIGTYVKKYNIVDIQNGDKIVGTSAPSSRLWNEALVGDSIYKQPGDINCVLVRSGKRITMPFIDFRPECEQETVVQ